MKENKIIDGGMLFDESGFDPFGEPEVKDYDMVESCGGIPFVVAAPLPGNEPTAEAKKILEAADVIVENGDGEPTPENDPTAVPKPEAGTTELVFILDKSGSMSGMEADVIGGFNSLIEKQRADGSGEVIVSTVLFANGLEMLHDRIPIAEVAPLTREDYRPAGCTALYDAIGRTVRHIERVHGYIRPTDIPKKTVFVITTDGEENASREFRLDAVKKTVEAGKARGYEFMFLAANIDAFATASGLGIGRKNTASYSVEDETDVMFSAVCEAVSCLRENGCVEESMTERIGRRRR